ncbi:sigma-70 family RNA polymerase sigma factor [Actinoplanes oblitus]|uniref:RNA polymerase sigma factor n=1 Tax=Actinoplanes oblitus TaxID=3040509 RepID=A0ABY8WPT6_9ACTN|nr:sigma-70 family RNA polymerase sigma factor [Actinoplanes oblitus]WIM98324.1 sigma-70 family RNA polymerase sigma factor [Actinoplanes oblitus]
MTESRTAVRREGADLVRDAQRGDVAALDQLVTGHLSLIYNVVGRALDGHPDVDDIVQETMLKAIRGLGALRQADRFRSWLIAIAYREVQLHLRSRKMTVLRQHPEPVDVADPVGDFAERTTAELVAGEQRRELAEAGRWLEETDRELLALWWQEASGQLTRAELAATLGVKPKHAAVRVQRMKAQVDLARGVVRALRAKPLCPDLSHLIRPWDGAADSVWRKRLARHVRDCARCAVRQGGLIPPEQLLLGMAALPVPLGLTAALQAAIHSGSAAPAVVTAAKGTALLAFAQHKALTVAAVTAVAVGGGFAYAVHHSPAGPESSLAVPAPAVSVTTTAAPKATTTTTTPSPKITFRADIHVAPGGSDSADGTAEHPYASVAKAVTVVRPGQTIALRGGTYRPKRPVSITTSGTAAKRITLTAYPGEHPVLDMSGIPADQYAITQRAGHWTVRDLEIKDAPSSGYVCSACVGTVFERLAVHGSGSAGLMLRDPGTSGNQILDSDFYDNRGSGVAVQFGDGGGNRLRGNRAFRNGGDGVNLGDFHSPVSVQYNWSFRNGANGFAVGGGTPSPAAAHTIRHNAAWHNDGHGFVDEGNTAALTLGNNTAYRNTGLGFAIGTAPATLRSNVAAGNTQGEQGLSAAAEATHNSWQETVPRFRSVDPGVAEGSRTAGGALPPTRFLATTTGTGAAMSGGA